MLQSEGFAPLDGGTALPLPEALARADVDDALLGSLPAEARGLFANLQRNAATLVIARPLVFRPALDVHYLDITVYYSSYSHRPLVWELRMTKPRAYLRLLTDKYGRPQALGPKRWLWEWNHDLLVFDIASEPDGRELGRARFLFVQNFGDHARGAGASPE